MKRHHLLLAALPLVTSGFGCMLSPEHGDWIDSIFHDVTFNIMSPWENANYVLETAELDANGNVITWHFLAAGQTDTFFLTDPEGRDLYLDALKTSILVGWKPAPGPGCGGTDCHYRVRVRARVQTPWGTTLPAYTFDDGTHNCRLNALGSGGADDVITDCARSESWVEVYAYGP